MSESEEGRRQLRKEYVKRGAKLAGFHGEIKVTIELESGGVGESTAEEVLKRMVDRLMEDVALLPTIGAWAIRKVTGTYEPYKSGFTEPCRYEWVKKEKTP